MSEHLGGAVARQHRDGRARHCAAVLIPQKGWTAVHSASRGYHTAFGAARAPSRRVPAILAGMTLNRAQECVIFHIAYLRQCLACARPVSLSGDKSSVV